jgi:hypothetical protein
MNYLIINQRNYSTSVRTLLQLLSITILTFFTGCTKDTLDEPLSSSGESAVMSSAATSQNSGNAIGFSGQATAIKATILGISTAFSETKPLPSSGGAEKETLLEAGIPSTLSAQVLHASTVGQGNKSQSEASVANLSVTVVGNTITAGFLQSRASAVCADGNQSTSGSSEIASLTVNGQNITVTGEPNQTIALPLGAGSIIINEQKRSSEGKHGSIDVTALHIIVPGVADVAIASVHADITCSGKADCAGTDFITGGGWINAPSGNRGTFAVAGGVKQNGLWGHLTYIDHGTGLKVKGTSVTAYTAGTGNTRIIKGTCEINGVAGTYTATVTDNGEPGKNDLFDLQLSNGYHASGKLVGGNIQLHMPCK